MDTRIDPPPSSSWPRRGILALVGATAATVVASQGTGLAQPAAPVPNPRDRARERRRERERDRARKERREERRADREKDQNADNKTNISILQYLLTLELIEDNFYVEGLATLHPEDFNPFGTGVYDHLENIQAHEAAHVAELTRLIRSLGSNPTGPRCYSFDYTDADEFLDLAGFLENTIVAAYTGAVARLRSGRLQTTISTIATVEGRHAAYVSLITGNDPFPDAFDDAKAQQQILDTVDPYILDCDP